MKTFPKPNGIVLGLSGLLFLCSLAPFFLSEIPLFQPSKIALPPSLVYLPNEPLLQLSAQIFDDTPLLFSTSKNQIPAIEPKLLHSQPLFQLTHPSLYQTPLNKAPLNPNADYTLPLFVFTLFQKNWFRQRYHLSGSTP